MKSFFWSIEIIWLLSSLAFADNPIVQTNYAPDPATMVHNGTFYVYTGHDEDVLVDNFYTMNEWRVYSTTDMVNWTDHGSPLDYSTFSWSGGKAWAAQTVYRNGKFYWYVTAGLKGSNQPAIGVAVSDSPTGPFTDALGVPLIKNSWDDIDPTAFVDDDGQAYLYWGNPQLYYVKLNKDMTSYTGGIQKVPMTTQSFGTRTGDAKRATTYEEGPWFFKRKDLYYMVYAAGPLPEPIGYATAPGPTGPWTYGGEIMSSGGTGSFTNHPGVVEYKGKGYFAYHTGKLPGGGGYHRSVAIESFDFNPDGSIPKISMSTQGPDPVATLDPYKRVEAETMAWSEGLKVGENDQVGVYLTRIDNGDYLKVREVDFGTSGATHFKASFASAGQGGSIELHVGSLTGTLIGTLPISGTGGATTWKQDSVEVSSDAVGIKDLYLVFKGSGSSLFNLDYWQFTSASSCPPQRDSVCNGSFTDGKGGWALNVWAGGASGSVVDGKYQIQIDSIGTSNHHIQLIQSGLILEKGKSYRLTFDAYASASRTLEVNVEKHISPWTSYLQTLSQLELTTASKTYSVEFTMDESTDSSARISFNAGASTATIFLDNVAIQPIASALLPASKAVQAWIQMRQGESGLAE